MTNQPKFTQFNGHGTFTSGDCRIEMPFTVRRQFSHVVFSAQADHHRSILFAQFSKKQPWSLSGQLDDDRPVHSDQLVHTGWDFEGRAQFSPLAGVLIGQSLQSPLVETQYPLIGLFSGELSIKDSDWAIEVFNSAENTGGAEDLSRAWGIPLEGLTLRLAKNQTTFDEHNEKAREIMLLLSLAVGNGVTSHRQIADWGDHSTMEVWRQYTGDEIGPGNIVPDFRLGKFLEQVLPVWNRWGQDAKSNIRLAVSYINLSGKGYLDTRLFQITQAWEFLAAAWVPKGALNALENDLRKRVKFSYREWKSEHSGVDPNGSWGKRITFPFEWPVMKRQIESLAQSVGVDLAKWALT